MIGGDVKLLQLVRFFFERCLENDESQSTTLTATFPKGGVVGVFASAGWLVPDFYCLSHSVQPRRTAPGERSWPVQCGDVVNSFGECWNGWTRPVSRRPCRSELFRSKHHRHGCPWQKALCRTVTVPFQPCLESKGWLHFLQRYPHHRHTSWASFWPLQSMILSRVLVVLHHWSWLFAVLYDQRTKFSSRRVSLTNGG